MQQRDLKRDPKRDIAIIGAGIGGLTLALALEQRGFAPPSTNAPPRWAKWARA